MYGTQSHTISPYFCTQDFDTVLSRKNTYSTKWDFYAEYFDTARVTNDVLPICIADMDFQCAAPIRDAIQRVASHGIYGYSQPPSHINNIISQWLLKEHQWNVKEDIILYTTTAITGLYFILQALTQENDTIIVHQPAYPPISSTIKGAKRTVLAHELIKKGNSYVIDFDALDQDLSRAAMFVMCNPQNPTGMIYTEDELVKIAELCKKHNVIVVSDDVQCEIVYPPYAYIPLHRAVMRRLPDFEQNIITILSPNKLFNTAGIKSGYMLVPNEMYRIKIKHTQQACIGSSILSPFAIAVLESAYGLCASWKKEIVAYLKGNQDFLYSFMHSHMPEITIAHSSSTYLAWLDFSAYMHKHNITYEQLRDLIWNGAHVGLSSGLSFGLGGNNHMRLNFGCPRSILEKGLFLIANCINKTKKKKK